MDYDDFFRKAFIEGLLADDLCKSMAIGRELYGPTYMHLKEERLEEVEHIKRIRLLFNNKRRVYAESFDFSSFAEFYDWHQAQYKK
ncbi:MAG: hypothetical protein ACI83B_001144 [Sediminicola sp.]|jgi:hypothetical protein